MFYFFSSCQPGSRAQTVEYVRARTDTVQITTKEINKLKLNENKIKLPIIVGHLTGAVINLYDYWVNAAKLAMKKKNKHDTTCDIRSDNIARDIPISKDA